MSSNIAREPTRIPWTRRPLSAIGCGSILVPSPSSTPISETVPPGRVALIDCVRRARARRPRPRGRRRASGELEHAVRPVRRRHVVDRLPGAELPRALELLVALRGRDHARAGHQRELEREDRDPARALDEDRLARLGPCPFVTSACQAVTAAHGSVDASSSLRCSGTWTSPSSCSDDVVGEHAVEPAREHRAVGRGHERVAVEPALEDDGRDAVSHLARVRRLSRPRRPRRRRPSTAAAASSHAAWGDAVLDHERRRGS